MGTTKTQLFNEQQNKLANLAKAFAHPARVAIIEYILRQPSCICNDLVEELPLSQSTISQHLKELKTIGIIKGEIDGPRMCYCINEPVWEEAKSMIIGLFNTKTAFSKCC
ncbi:MAG: metalloregulator ArsR/SmtB family transcription factor [Bacteroidota bacterium]|nr:metalloregulator ArsR/SmtB family transcription factor [Bacteroidota bacterium]